MGSRPAAIVVSSAGGAILLAGVALGGFYAVLIGCFAAVLTVRSGLDVSEPAVTAAILTGGAAVVASFRAESTMIPVAAAFGVFVASELAAVGRQLVINDPTPLRVLLGRSAALTGAGAMVAAGAWVLERWRVPSPLAVGALFALCAGALAFALRSAISRRRGAPAADR